MDNLMPLFIGLGVVGVLVVAVSIWLVATYNGLVRRKQSVDEAWSGISEQLQRRAELVPKLISTVQGYAPHERQLFDEVSAVRSKSLSAATPAEAAIEEPELTKSIRAVFSVAEGYPKLLASEGYLQLQQELGDTDDKVQAARRVYNSTVRDFNTRIRIFPNTLFARRSDFNERDFFEVDDPHAKAEPPRVQF